MVLENMRVESLELSIFFPAYNEAENITDSIKHALTAVKKITDRYEVIVVNDGSSDTTGKIAEDIASRNDKVRVIHHARNQGYGAAVWSGIQAARYRYVFFTDADLQFDLAELENLAKYVPSYRVVIGYRAKRRDPFMRLVNAKGWNILNRLLFGLKVRDIDCAFKIFERDLVAALPVKSRGAAMSAEMLIRLARDGVIFKEVPVTHLPRRKGSATGANPAVIVRAFKELLTLYRGDLGNITHWQAIKFAAVGVINTLIDITTYFLLTRGIDFFGDNLAIAKALSFGLGTISSFNLNRRWTFNAHGKATLGEIASFYTMVGSSLIINVMSLYVMVRIFGLYDMIAVLFATIISFSWGFVLSKFWVFTDRRGKHRDFRKAKKSPASGRA